jgi:hypothetical protein
MSLFEQIFRPKQAKESKKALENATGYFKTITGYEPVFHNWEGAIYESELVRSAIDARARHISKLKFEVMGSAQQQLQTKLRQGPNQWETWSAFLYRVSTILDNQNTCFVTPVFDADMKITGYFPVMPDRCTIVEYEGMPWLRYKFKKGQYAAVELRKVAVLTKFQYKRDFFGTDNDALNSTLDLIDINNQGIKEGVKSSATYRFMAQLNNFTKHDDLVKERERFTTENFSKEARGGGLLLFPNTYANIKQISTTPFTVDRDQMELIQTNVFNYFGVNADILQNKAYGDAWSAFYEGCVEEFAIKFSEGLTKAMFSERERANGAEVMLTANRLQYMGNKDKMAFTNDGLDRGMLSVNEAREVWNLAPVEGGDVRTIRGEYKNADDLNEEETTNE